MANNFESPTSIRLSISQKALKGKCDASTRVSTYKITDFSMSDTFCVCTQKTHEEFYQIIPKRKLSKIMQQSG